MTRQLYHNGVIRAVSGSAALADWVLVEDGWECPGNVCTPVCGDGILIRPLQPGGWDHFFADPTLRLPDEFERPAQPPDQERLP